MGKYFSESDVTTIIDDIMGKANHVSPNANKGAAASQTLDSIRILKDRLTQKAALKFVYTDKTLIPEPLVRFVNEYLDGKHTLSEASQILDDLQADMKKNYFRRKIVFSDPERLPTSKVFDPTGEFANTIKGKLESIVAEYVKTEPKNISDEIYKKSFENSTNEMDYDVLVGSLAEIIARKDYPNLVLSIGARDPTARELAVKYLNALEVAHRKLGTSIYGSTIDKNEILEERLEQKVYKKELEIYRQGMNRLLVL